MSLKHLKEQFVSDLSGGLIPEIYKVTAVSLGGFFAHSLYASHVARRVPTLATFPLLFVLEYYLDVLLLLQSTTVLSNDLKTLYTYLGVVVWALLVIMVMFKARKLKPAKMPMVDLPTVSYITAYRSHMIIITNIAILAVDFHIFPRRFAKVETWGTSLMDLGVGLFVFSMGLANSRSVIKKNLALGVSNKSYWSLLFHSTLKALPVLALGIIRLVSVKSLQYQEHVTEYGVHWNFFMTLGLLPIFLGVVDPIFSVMPRFVVALLIGAIYEYQLSFNGLSAYILDELNRMNSIWSMNKEGLFSFLGYCSIFIFGQAFGPFLLTSKPKPNNLLGVGFLPNSKAYRYLTVSASQGLIVCSVFSMVLFKLSVDSMYLGNISRRLANFPYVLWVVSYNSVFLLGYNLIERYIGPLSSSILESINRNGLAIFLAANLLTGLINMTINTLEVSNAVAYAILIVYSFSWIMLAKVLDHYKIYIKL